MEPASKRSMVSTANTGVVLSTDVLWEILLRVGAKPLCRFRAACRSWCSLLSDPSFIKAHAALRPGLVLALSGENDRIDMSDLSGNVVRRICIAPEDAGVPDAHPGPFYLFLDHNRVRVLDPDTGAVSTLPMDHLQHRVVGSSYEALYALGRVASTGQRKVLRVVTGYENPRVEQHCHVFNLGSDDDRRCWRPVASAPLCVKFHFPYRVAVHSAVIQGVVYLLPDRKYPTFDIFPPDGGVAATDTNRVMSFVLEAEEWRPATIPGPPSLNDDTDHRCTTKLAKLNGRLAMLRHPRHFHYYPAVKIDLWFAMDLEKGVWVKENSIRLELPSSRPCLWVFALDVQLSMVLDDGRVVFHYSGNGASRNWSWPEPDWTTRIYDPETKSCTDVPHQDGARFIVGMYRGSMSCLESL